MSISISGNGSFTGATADYSFDQSVGIAGTLTYEDVTNIDSVGVITARQGLDTPTDLVLRTGGTEKVRIDSSGNVGIGISTPLALLDVALLGSGSRRLLVNYTDSTINLQGSNSSATNENLRLSGDNLKFASGSGTGTERMRIDSSGNVGIGTDSVPTNFRVEISEPGSVGLNLRNTNNSAGDSGRIAFSQGSGNLASSNTFVDIIAEADTVSPLTGTLKFRTNKGNDLTEVMQIDSSGRMSMNGGVVYSTGGTTNINSTFNVDVTVKNDSGGGLGGCYKVLAGISHVNFSSYGAAYETWAAGRGTTINETIVQVNQTSTQGGSWSISKPTNTTLRVTHTGGTLSASGNYFVVVYATA